MSELNLTIQKMITLQLTVTQFKYLYGLVNLEAAVITDEELLNEVIIPLDNKMRAIEELENVKTN